MLNSFLDKYIDNLISKNFGKTINYQVEFPKWNRYILKDKDMSDFLDNSLNGKIFGQIMYSDEKEKEVILHWDDDGLNIYSKKHSDIFYSLFSNYMLEAYLLMFDKNENIELDDIVGKFMFKRRPKISRGKMKIS